MTASWHTFKNLVRPILLPVLEGSKQAPHNLFGTQKIWLDLSFSCRRRVSLILRKVVLTELYDLGFAVDACAGYQSTCRKMIIVSKHPG